MLFSVRLYRRGKLSDFLSLHEKKAGGNDELRVKENDLEKEMEKAKLSSPPAAKRLRHHQNAKRPLKPLLKIFLPVFFHALPP